MNQLTIKEALEQGYEYCVHNSEDIQRLIGISDIEEIDFVKDDIRIVDKDPKHPTGISSKDLADMIAEQLQCDYNEVVDDEDSVYDVIKKLDFTEMENKIIAALSEINYYPVTDIKLIP